MDHKPKWAIVARPRPTFGTKIRRAVLLHTDVNVKDNAERMQKIPNVCWHCSEPLTEKTVQIDHHPQPFRYIATLWCDPMAWVPPLCRCRNIMTTDPSYTGNLVPSCTRCNVSHQYEVSYDNLTYRWCSLACRLRLVICVGMLFMLMLGGAVTVSIFKI